MDYRVGSRLLFSIVLGVSIRSAGAEQLPLKIYSTADGLASDRIHCILSDSHGFLWFGTEDGISRFDGYGFTNLTGRDGVPGTDVYSIVEVRDGTYWAATNAGIFHWDPAREKPGRRASTDVIHVPAGRPADDVRALLEDPSGGLWVATHGGLYRLEKLGGAWSLRRSLLESRERPETSLVNALCEDPDGNLWVGTEGGLFRRSPGGSVDRIGGRDGSPQAVRCLLRERGGSLWVGSHGEGLFEVRRAGKTGEVTVRGAFSHEHGLAGNHVTSLFETSDGKIWASCHGGLTEISTDRGSIRSYTITEGLSAFGIWSLAEDRNGDLWVGSDNAGVMRLAPNGFRRFDARDGLANTCVASLFENRDGHICAFTRGMDLVVDRSFVECFDGGRFHPQRPPLQPGATFGWGWSQVALQDSRGEWWVPTVAGLYRFPAVSFERLGASRPRKVYTTRDGLPSNLVYRLFEDSRGDLWVSVLQADRRLVLWNRQMDSFRSFSAADGVPPADEPMSFAEDRGGAVWIGFNSSGLARYRGGRIGFFREADGAPSGRIEALHLDHDGRLWVAGDAGGVARIDRPEEDRPRFARYGVGQGLSSGNTFSLTEDRWGRIYIGTSRGLDRLDPRDGLVQHFTVDDGLARGDIETSLRDRQGNLWFGSTQGLSRLQPTAEASKRPPQIRITRVFAEGVRQPLPELGGNEVLLPSLGPGSAPLQIDFVALDFAPGGRPRYQYLLEGVDRDWSAATDQRSVVYGRLPPSRYRFRVRGVGNDGSIGPVPAEVRFTILPPLWRRPEVLALLAAGVAGIAYLLHRNRLKSALAVERVRIRVASDLHDDVGAGLSEIAILSELARRQHGEGQPGRTLSEIGDGARRLVDSMSDIVWSTDPRNDDVASLARRIRQFAANVLESQGIRWNLEVPPEFEARRLDPETRRQILLTVKEALVNVARHSGSTRASIRIVPGPDEILVEIEDDGRGFSPSKETPGHGLANMRARALALRGQFEVRARPSGGTLLLVRVPLRRRFGRRSAW